MSDERVPPGWDETRIRRALDHFENQTDAESTAEDEELMEGEHRTVMEVPRDLLSAVRSLIAKSRTV